MNTIEINSATELLSYLRPSGDHWRNSEVLPFDRPLWFYRGQRDASWELVPSRFRSSSLLDTSKRFHEEPAQTRYSEFTTIQRFVQLCDREGMMPSGFNLSSNSPNKSPWWSDIQQQIPLDTLEVYALAQHHGIETRLLDWTSSPYSAVYFAAAGNWRMSLNSDTQVPSHFAVWAFVHHGSRQVKILQPRFTDNLYLRSQRGCFSYDPLADSNYISKNEWVPHNRLILEDESMQDGTIATGRKMLVKIVAPSRISEEVLVLLRYEGIDEAALMPSLDAIARCTKDDLLLHKRESNQLI